EAEAEFTDACVLPAVQGPCRGWEPRWAYSPLLQQCHPFVYGGCEGNGNNFHSRESCEDACPVVDHHHHHH
uniref:WAP, follistatin/kazal, immunoglobulin, kunitz and netrin domain containing 1 n=1 Tax=Homo sapiens TaxID=9606 RepID=UPI0000EB65D5|nr:Chain A, WAP, follistatin/kazal, immunoglobulin, kunitz and netrin domain containing 1 [Homo sapiens]2DDJ_A Chain A, WAP, follistatin/kazal, immunoglobulin, kunitz and netrin domain containing 1 [Homo sapiens]